MVTNNKSDRDEVIPPTSPNSQSSQKADEVDALAQISSSILTLTETLDSLLQHITEKTRELLKCDASYITLLNEKTNQLFVKVTSGVITPEYKSSIFPSNQGIGGWVIHNEQPAICTDYETDPRRSQVVIDLVKREGITSLFAAPLRFGGKVGGVLFAFTRTKRQFTTEDSRLGSAFANLASISLQNSLMYSHEKETLAKLKQRNKYIQRASEIHDEFITTALEAGGINNITRNLARIIDMPVVVENRYGEILATEPNEMNNKETPSETRYKSVTKLARDYPHIREQIGLFTQTSKNQRYVIVNTPDLNGSTIRIVTPIVGNKQILGYLSVPLFRKNTLRPLDHAAIEYAVLVLALEMTKIRSIFEAEQRAMGDFLSSLLFGELGHTEQLVNRAAYLGYDLSEPRRVMIVRMDTSKMGKTEMSYDDQTDLLNRLLRKILPSITAISPGSTAISFNRDIAVLVVETHTEKYTTDSVSGRVAQIIKEAPKSIDPELSVTIGIGGLCHSPEEYKKSYEQGRKALEIARWLGKEGTILALESLGVYSLLFEPDNYKRLLKFSEESLGPLIQYDQKHHARLLETLSAYIRSNSSRKVAATKLFVHENTIGHRLEQIEKLCKVELSNQETRFALQLALQVWELGHK